MIEGIAILLGLFALLIAGSTALVRRRRGRKRPLLSWDDWFLAWAVGFLVTAVVVFLIAWLSFDQPAWLALLIGLGGTLAGGLYILLLAPSSSSDSEGQ